MSLLKTPQFWIDKFQMQKHPEGGYFVETYRSAETIPSSGLPDRFGGARSMSTAIYFLLTGSEFSAFHRIAADEVWHFYEGSGAEVAVIHPDGRFEWLRLGSRFEQGEQYQAWVPAGSWFASRALPADGYALVGCTVAPGFDFNDFELAKRNELIALFPQHKDIITEFTR
jgi:hypothetical protein